MKKSQIIIKSAIILAGFLGMVFFHDILLGLGISLPRVSDSPYLQKLFTRTAYFSPMIFGVLIAFPRKFVLLLGLSHPPVKPFIYALISCLPLFIIYPLFFEVKLSLDPYNVFSGSILSPVYEEIIFRAFFFGTLVGLLRWKFWQVVVLNALAFSFGHLYQAHDLMSTVFTVAITSVACIWWGWMFVRWRYNLWFPLFLHILMNFSFELFQIMGGTAAGGIATYAGRLMVIAISVWITLKYTDPMAPMAEAETKKPASKPVAMAG
jgi:hypothetical protein